MPAGAKFKTRALHQRREGIQLLKRCSGLRELDDDG